MKMSVKADLALVIGIITLFYLLFQCMFLHFERFDITILAIIGSLGVILYSTTHSEDDPEESQAQKY